MNLNLKQASAAIGILAGLFGSSITHAQVVTPTQWLAAQPKPAYKSGHTMPRLTRYGYQVPFDVTKELTERWGYALQFHEGYLNPEVVARLDDPNSREAKIAALTLSDPVKYPLFITVSRRVPQLGEPGAPDETWTRNASGQLLSGQLSSPDGNLWSPGEEPIYSTEAPDSVWALAGEYRAAPLRALIARGVPVDIVLNGGEYGMGFVGIDSNDAGAFWGQDPAHNNAVANTVWSGGRNGHSSAKKANSERIIADAVRAAAPQRSLYVLYTSGGGTLRNDFFGSDFYGGYWEHGRGINDIPSNEIYFKAFNSGFTGNRDVLTMALNATSKEITTGNPLSYNWLTGGWARGNPAEFLADINRWTGFLKCYFTAGMIGGNIGAYGDDNTSIAASFPSTSPLYHYQDLIAMSHVQALFSHVEGTIRNSDLLPGPSGHALSPQPAYEFPTGDDTARVLARKHRTQASWLVTAWAADGANRNVTVYIPELGQLTVEARIVGSVYKVTASNGNKTVIRIDNEGATYTSLADGTPVVSAQNLAIPAPIATNRLFWLAADSGVTADGAGKVSSWAGLGNGLTVTQTDAAKRPTLVSNAIGGKPALRFVNGQTWLGANLSSGGDAYIGNLSIFTVFTGAGLNSNKRVVAGADTSGADYSGGFNVNDAIISLDEVRDGVLLKTTSTNCATRLVSLYVGDAIGPAGPAYGFGLDGDIAEILIYKGLSNGAQAQITSYLRDKYSIRPNTAVVNGSFEDHAVVGYQYAQYTPGSGGWVHANNSIVQANGSTWNAPNAPNGNQTAMLNGAGNHNGTMSQTIQFSAGTYKISLKAARRAGQIQPIKISLDGTQIGALLIPPSDVFTDFTTVNFRASAGFHTLRLEATDGTGDKSTFIDQIALNLITEVFNGSFETPAVSGFQYNPTDSAWTFDTNSAIQANGSSLNAAIAPEGIQTAVLKGSNAGLGGISQTVNFGAGGTYRINFKAARRTGQIQPLKFSVNGTQVGNLITPTSDLFAVYTTGSFTVSPGSHLLRFEATNGVGDQSTFIDQVTLSAPIFTPTLLGGSFEAPSVGSGFVYNPTGSSWLFSNQSAIQTNGSAWNAASAPDGIQTAVLQNLGSISQTLGLAAGTYSVGFKAGRRGGQIQPVKFSVNGTQIGTLITPTSSAFGNYTTATFTISAGNHTLKLQGTDGTSDKSTFIDQVVLNVISLDSAPLEIHAFTRDINGNFTIGFLGAPTTNYQVTKSDLVAPFGPLTIPLSATTDAEGVGQAVIPASEASEMKEFYRIEK